MSKKRKRRIVLSVCLVLIGIIFSLCLIVVFVFLTPKDRTAIFTESKTVSYDNADRTYRVVKPKAKVNKIVIGLHGFGDHSRQFAYYTALHNLADDNTLVVYPDAIKPSSSEYKTGWNAGFCCGSGWVSKTDDVGFLVNLVDNLKQEYDADDATVFATGFSNGSFMAQRLAAERPDTFKAIAGVSGSIGTEKDQLKPKQPVPILLMHGKNDITIPFDGGQSGSDPDFVWRSFDETVQAWQDVNQDKAETKTIVFPDDTHKWNDWRTFNIWHKKPNASKEVIDFFNNNL